MDGCRSWRAIVTGIAAPENGSTMALQTPSWKMPDVAGSHHLQSAQDLTVVWVMGRVSMFCA